MEPQSFHFTNSAMWWLLILLAGFLAITSSGFIWISQSGLNALSKEMYHMLCHQFHWRSYSHNGTIMAVCSRCFGIYSGLLFGMIIMPGLYKMYGNWYSISFKIMAGTFLINVIDFLGNLLGIWTNTLSSRATLGIFFGIAVSFVILSTYYKQQTQSKLWSQSSKNPI